ncbi:MAG: TOBE domain-containing protein [Candidatus Accumulibacter sp.]|nr:TOBE domain-containing protein [Accumulibacter sp.]
MKPILPHRLQGRLQVDTESGAFLGDTRIRLLEAIAVHGSISRAAEAVPLSYKAAWDAVDAMNNLSDQPLVVRSAGGRHGGGTALTGYGTRLVAFYRALETEYQNLLDRLAPTVADAPAGGPEHFQRIIRRLAMRASARNQFSGKVNALREGDVDFEVCVRLDEQTELAAVITRESAETLDLRIGAEVTALVKASSILLHTDPDLKLSARNQLWGSVARVLDGAVNAEVVLTISGGKMVSAAVTHESLKRLNLAEGARACAVFQASSIILCQYA